MILEAIRKEMESLAVLSVLAEPLGICEDIISALTLVAVTPVTRHLAPIALQTLSRFLDPLTVMHVSTLTHSSELLKQIRWPWYIIPSRERRFCVSI